MGAHLIDNKEDSGSDSNSYPSSLSLQLSSLKFAICDIFEVKDHLTEFGNPDWLRTREAAENTSLMVTPLLKNGVKRVGKNFMDELTFGNGSVDGKVSVHETHLAVETPGDVGDEILDVTEGRTNGSARLLGVEI
ncbi:Amidase [Parasponia andersonii]|uniref:Amidase n=1 Tax=Parasponia andersonii TaxID=3476 RepID=A0A2P5C000_PARAD|nr:Amidase [Parasponia andersonii]